MARLNACVSAAKCFVLEERRGGRGKNKSTSVCPVYKFRQSRKGEHDIWMFEDSFVTHQEGGIQKGRKQCYGLKLFSPAGLGNLMGLSEV